MGTLVGVGLAVGDGDGVPDGDGIGVDVGVVLGLAGAAVMVGNGVNVEDTGGAAHASATVATAMRRGAETARRVLCSPTAMRRVSGR
jgi:hypothetical protein